MKNFFLDVDPDSDQPPADAEPRTLAEKVYRQLRSDIVWGRLLPGAPLRSDDLRRTYDAGISPLREALSRLLSERLVTASEQRGFRVAALSVDIVRDTMEARLAIEGDALAKAIERGDIAWEASIVAAYHTLASVPVPSVDAPEAEAWARYHRAFHMALIAGCRSRWLIALSGLLFDQADRHRIVTIRNRQLMTQPRDAGAEHRALMEAAIARDTAQAVAVLTTHYRSTAEGLIALINSRGAEI